MGAVGLYLEPNNDTFCWHLTSDVASVDSYKILNGSMNAKPLVHVSDDVEYQEALTESFFTSTTMGSEVLEIAIRQTCGLKIHKEPRVITSATIKTND